MRQEERVRADTAGQDKTGVKIEGLTGINPITGKEIPIYISDYVMMGLSLIHI